MRQEMSQIQTIIWVTLHTRSCTWGMKNPNPIKKFIFVFYRACGAEKRYSACVTVKYSSKKKNDFQTIRFLDSQPSKDDVIRPPAGL